MLSVCNAPRFDHSVTEGQKDVQCKLCFCLNVILNLYTARLAVCARTQHLLQKHFLFPRNKNVSELF